MSLLYIPMAVIGLVLLAVVVRMAIGPTQADRAVAADLTFFCFIALVALFGALLDTPAVFDLVLIGTLIGFVAAIWLARLIRKEKRG